MVIKNGNDIYYRPPPPHSHFIDEIEMFMVTNYFFTKLVGKAKWMRIDAYLHQSDPMKTDAGMQKSLPNLDSV